MLTNSSDSTDFGKVIFASLNIILLILGFLMVAFPISTANGDAPIIKASLGTAPTIDGMWSPGEWDDALEYIATNSTLTSYVRVKWNDSYLYVLIDSPWDTTNSSIFPYENTWIAFDTMHNHGEVPQTDDYLHSTSGMVGHQGDGSQWTTVIPPSDYRAQSSSSDEWGPGVQPSPKNSTPHRIDEFKIPLALVGQIGQTGGFYFLVVDEIDDPDGAGPLASPTYVEWPSGAGGNSAGWPSGGEDPCPAPNDWGHLTFLQSPTASFTHSPDTPDVNETVFFDASASQDADGSIINFVWDFGDGNVTTVNTTMLTHTFSSTGSYAVHLTVIDNDGLNCSATHFINVGIRAEFTFSPSAPNPGTIITFDATASHSRGGTIVNYAWKWGDTSSNVTANPMVNHTYSAGGSYNVELTVTDDMGLNGSIIHVVNVGVPVANFTLLPSAPNLEDIVVFDASGSHDPDGTIISYAWDWGDQSSNITADEVISHAFLTSGNYNVTLTVTDNLGLSSSFTQRVVVYAGREVHFSFAPSNPNVGETVTFNASLSKDPGGAIASYTWDFDDGNVTAVDTVTITHNFQEKGGYNVKLTITDDSGQMSHYNNTVNVGVASVQATAPFSSRIPTIDGVWSLDEWTDTSEYVINGTGGEGFILLKWGPGNVTGDFLYILIDSPWDTTNATMSGLENAFVAFDTLNDKSTVGPQTDDYLFNNGYSYWILAWQGNGTVWKRTQIDYTGMGYFAARGSGLSPKSDTAHRIDELRIPLEVIGNSTSGFYVNVVDDSSDPDQDWGPEEPPTDWVEWPPSAGGDSAGWPADPYIDPCPTPDKWGLLIFEAPMKAQSNIALDISSASITIGESVTITGIVSNDTGPIPGAVINIQYRLTGTTEWTNIATSTTGPTGTTLYSWEPAEAGTYEIKTVWDGNEAHYGAESEIETLQVTSEQLPVLIIGGVIIVIVAIAAFAFYMLKARKPEK